MINHFNYFLKNFALFYSIDNVKIHYGENNREDVNIISSINKNFWENNTDIDYNKVVWLEWKGTSIPFLFSFDNQKEIISIIDNKAFINYDIIASAFYFLSGWYEINALKDDLGRIEYKNTIFNKLNIIGIPIVNYYFDILYEAIRSTNNSIKKIEHWGDNKLAIALTHDIDTCNTGWIEDSFNELKLKRFSSMAKIIIKRIFNDDEWYNFTKILNIEKKFNANSTFFFLAQKGKTGEYKNSDYDIESKKIQNTISELNKSNCEVGVHGSFGTHNNIKKLSIDISRINFPEIIGNRFHFLMYDNINTINTLEKSNLKYDSTIGFAEQIGFRRGTCYPFFLYDFINNRCSSIIEIPLIAMDTTLQSQKYMNLTHNEAFIEIKKTISEVEKFNGVFTILWHNNFFSDHKYYQWKDVYINTLEYCQSRNGLLTNAKTIYNLILNNEE